MEPRDTAPSELQTINTTRANPDTTIESFKGFDSNWQCRGFQYQVGETYTHDGDVVACKSGFHACEHPLDVLRYYSPATSKFAIVHQSGDLAKEIDSDTKIASRELTVVTEITINELITAAIAYTFRHATPVDPDSPTPTPASATGDSGAASATGHSGAASATGKDAVAIASGFYGRAQASPTSAICLVKRNADGSIRHIRSSKVGENDIEPDVWYTLDNDGNFERVNVQISAV